MSIENLIRAPRSNGKILKDGTHSDMGDEFDEHPSKKSFTNELKIHKEGQLNDQHTHKSSGKCDSSILYSLLSGQENAHTARFRSRLFLRSPKEVKSHLLAKFHTGRRKPLQTIRNLHIDRTIVDTDEEYNLGTAQLDMQGQRNITGKKSTFPNTKKCIKIRNTVQSNDISWSKRARTVRLQRTDRCRREENYQPYEWNHEVRCNVTSSGMTDQPLDLSNRKSDSSNHYNKRHGIPILNGGKISDDAVNKILLPDQKYQNHTPYQIINLFPQLYMTAVLATITSLHGTTKTESKSTDVFNRLRRICALGGFKELLHRIPTNPPPQKTIEENIKNIQTILNLPLLTSVRHSTSSGILPKQIVTSCSTSNNSSTSLSANIHSSNRGANMNQFTGDCLSYNPHISAILKSNIHSYILELYKLIYNPEEMIISTVKHLQSHQGGATTDIPPANVVARQECIHHLCSIILHSIKQSTSRRRELMKTNWHRSFVLHAYPDALDAICDRIPFVKSTHCLDGWTASMLGKVEQEFSQLCETLKVLDLDEPSIAFAMVYFATLGEQDRDYSGKLEEILTQQSTEKMDDSNSTIYNESISNVKKAIRHLYNLDKEFVQALISSGSSENNFDVIIDEL